MLCYTANQTISSRLREGFPKGRTLPVDAKSILDAWSALEALTPRTFTDPRENVRNREDRLVVPLRGSDGSLPWERGLSARGGKDLFFKIPFGVIPLGPAIRILGEAFGDHDERHVPKRDVMAFAGMFVVNHEGRPCPERNPAVSVFAWSLLKCLQDKVSDFPKWTEQGGFISNRLQEELCVFEDDDAKVTRPLDREAFDAVMASFRSMIPLPEDILQESGAAYMVEQAPGWSPPGTGAMDSYFLSDLVKAKRLCSEGRLRPVMRRFLGIDQPGREVDLLADFGELRKVVDPQRAPPAKWPSPNGESLVTLQQAAVNLTRLEIDRGGLMSVNGPPGTGKTTLLRDVVAACVTQRAIAMMQFDDPLKAFSRTDKVVRDGANAIPVWEVDRRLQGHDVVVASSNNRAVENVSRELPLAKAVRPSLRRQGYYAPLAKVVHQPNREVDPDDEFAADDDAPLEDVGEIESWGLVSAVLGRRRNRAFFKSKFWTDPDWGFSSYLSAACGRPVKMVEVRDGTGASIGERRPLILDEMPPPLGRDEALAAFGEARSAFRAALSEARAAMAAISASAPNPLPGAVAVDDAFFASGHEAWNMATPWMTERSERAREAVFEAALGLHVAFVAAAAAPMLDNLGGAMAAIFGQSRAEPATTAVLWSSFSMVVPVVSTTFASVPTMFASFPYEGIGWLLIDEAGQAAPQAAVAAMMRARRALAVGDPLQIPPVTTLPPGITRKIGESFGLETAAWIAPEASVQTLADRASKYRSTFRVGLGGKRVAGAPLLVHRRCAEPMFGVSNAIAYDGQMVHATPSRADCSIGSVLGPSRWIDVPGREDLADKWSDREGAEVVSLFRALVDSGASSPDVYVISPFRVVAAKMRRALLAERELMAALGIDDRWVGERVGTIHTAQGREADGVVLVLGAPDRAHAGARMWAGQDPNILNVAVSRAKGSLYVVGSAAAWRRVGHVARLAEVLSAGGMREAA